MDIVKKGISWLLKKNRLRIHRYMHKEYDNNPFRIDKALDDAKRSGKIITLDILPTNKPIYWNCIFDHKGRKTRFQLLKKWQKLVDEYIIFLQGYSDVMLRQIDLSRIHVVFLDGAHDYDTVKTELSYVKTRQSKGDVIVCDDYTEGQYPGLVDAVKQFLSAGEYSFKIYYASTGRGYLYCKKK